MDLSGSNGSTTKLPKEQMSFDDTKGGVKDLVDAGVVKIPKIYVRPADELAKELPPSGDHIHIDVPVIDLGGIERGEGRKQIVDAVRHVSEEWGFFHVVNHGIPIRVLDGMVDGVRRFHEQDGEEKIGLYSDDLRKKVRYASKLGVYKEQFATWRDSLIIRVTETDDNLEEVPSCCRDVAMEYINHATTLADTLFELLSEALGLDACHLEKLECAIARTLACHYYPSCPQPDLAQGLQKHSDTSFLTILLQDQIGGLQVMTESKWLDVQPIQGALLVNIGDLLQMISNDKFKSKMHRVLANRNSEPRISVACFFDGAHVPKKYGPIGELISEESPQVYKEFTVSEYYYAKYSPERAIDGDTAFDQFKL